MVWYSRMTTSPRRQSWLSQAVVPDEGVQDTQPLGNSREFPQSPDSDFFVEERSTNVPHTKVVTSTPPPSPDGGWKIVTSRRRHRKKAGHYIVDGNLYSPTYTEEEVPILPKPKEQVIQLNERMTTLAAVYNCKSRKTDLDVRGIRAATTLVSLKRRKPLRSIPEADYDIIMDKAEELNQLSYKEVATLAFARGSHRTNAKEEKRRTHLRKKARLKASIKPNAEPPFDWARWRSEKDNPDYIAGPSVGLESHSCPYTGSDYPAPGAPIAPPSPPQRTPTPPSTPSSPPIAEEEFEKIAEESPPLETNDEVLSMLEDFKLSDICNESPEAMKYISYIENILIFGYQVARATTLTDIFVATVGYIKMHSQKSVVEQVMQVVNNMLKSFPKDEIAPNAWSLTSVQTGWDLLKTNTVFAKISYLLTAAMSLTVCSVKDIKWDPVALELVGPDAAVTQYKAFDVVDALLSTFTWMCETGYRVFQERSLAPILYSDVKVREYNLLVDYIIAHSDNVLAGNAEDVPGFEVKVDEAIQKTAEMKKARSNGPTSLWLQTRYEKLSEIKTQITCKYENTSMKFQPLGLSFTGASGVGKTALTKIGMRMSLQAMGYEPDMKRVMTDDMQDEYDSSLTTDIIGMILDDIGQGKAQFAKTSPTDRIIKFFNNVAAKAVKAELNLKGMVFVAFKVGVVTSNFEDFGARHYSDKPEAVLRRFVHTRVSIKPEYRIPGGVSLNTDHPDLVYSKDGLCHDVWTLTIEECFIYESKTGKEAYKFRVLVLPRSFPGRKICKDLSLNEWMDVIVFLAKRHKAKQDTLLSEARLFDEMALCKACCKPPGYCKCVDKETVKPNGLEVIADVAQEVVTRSVKNYLSGILSPVQYFNSWLGYYPVRTMATKTLSQELTQAMSETLTPILIAATPQAVFESPLFQRMVNYWQASSAMYNLHRPMQCLSVATLCGIGYSGFQRSWKGFGASLILGWGGSMTMWSMYRSRVRKLQAAYQQRRDALPACLVEMRDKHVPTGAMVTAGLIVTAKLFQMWRKKNVEPNTISPESMQTSPGWFGAMMKKLGLEVNTDSRTKTAVPEHLTFAFKDKNLFWAEFSIADRPLVGCNIFFPRKGVAWFPKHLLYKGFNMSSAQDQFGVVKVYRSCSNSPGSVFTFKFRLQVNAICAEDLDLVVCEVANCPDLRNQLKWLPLTRPKGITMAKILMRTKDEYLHEVVNPEMGDVYHSQMDFYGGSYDMQTCGVGKCMGLVVSQTSSPCILGFHIGQATGKSYSVMQTVTKPQADALISQLESLRDVCLSSEPCDIPTQQYGINLLDRSEIHPNCMASKLSGEDFVEIYGSTRLRSRMKSNVVQSPISPYVTAVTGVENQWGPPQMEPNWKAFNATLEHVVDPADMFDPGLLSRARHDWLKPIIGVAKLFRQIDPYARPLTFDESINGIDGVRFIDPIVMNTSMGFPVFGPKNHWFDGYRRPHPKVIEEYERLENQWRKGERAYPVSTATLKDEPTSTAKVRVFQAGAVAMGMHMRRVFLPVVRFLSLHPELSECAVGVNAMSKQWSQLMDHIKKFDQKRVIAWDYSKYDVRMNSQMVKAVLLSLIEIAEALGYDEYTLRIMRMMVNDIAHPLLDWNGILMMVFNINTSGNSITVYINSIAGSLYVRMGFFSIYGVETDFRGRVAAMTYGDDFMGTVHHLFRRFNFRTYKEFLSEHNMKITLPTKTDEVVDDLPIESTDFLKRKSNYIPEIQTSLGALDEQSIFKSWHSNLKSKSVLATEVACSCIETGLHEFFAHGREVYERRRNQATLICQMAGLRVPATSYTFDDRVVFWKAKYQSN